MTQCPNKRHRWASTGWFRWLHHALLTVSLGCPMVGQCEAQTEKSEPPIAQSNPRPKTDSKKTPKVEKKAARRIAVEMLALAPARPVDRNVQFLQNKIRVECAFVRRVCELSDAQEASLAQLDENWIAQQMQPTEEDRIEAAAARVAEIGARVRRNPDVRIACVRRVLGQIDTEIESVLEPAQRREFRREKEARTRFRANASAAATVAIIDQCAVLSTEQATALQADLVAYALRKEPQTLARIWGRICQLYDSSIVEKHLTTAQIDALGQVGFVPMSRLSFSINAARQNSEYVIAK